MRAGAPVYALEAAIFIAGAAVQWLRDGLGIIANASETEALARSIESTDGVYFVPALTGLGAPHWEAAARGTIVGLTRGTGRAHLVRAALEAMAFGTADVLASMRDASGAAFDRLRVDGGATNNDWLMQFQADVLGVPVERPDMVETTALGAAGLAGLAAGVWASAEEFIATRQLHAIRAERHRCGRAFDRRLASRGARRRVVGARRGHGMSGERRASRALRRARGMSPVWPPGERDSDSVGSCAAARDARGSSAGKGGGGGRTTVRRTRGKTLFRWLEQAGIDEATAGGASTSPPSRDVFPGRVRAAAAIGFRRATNRTRAPCGSSASSRSFGRDCSFRWAAGDRAISSTARSTSSSDARSTSSMPAERRWRFRCRIRPARAVGSIKAIIRSLLARAIARIARRARSAWTPAQAETPERGLMHGLMLVFAMHFGPEHPGGDSWFARIKRSTFSPPHSCRRCRLAGSGRRGCRERVAGGRDRGIVVREHRKGDQRSAVRGCSAAKTSRGTLEESRRVRAASQNGTIEPTGVWRYIEGGAPS